MVLGDSIVGLRHVGGIGDLTQIGVALGENIGFRVVFKMNAARTIDHIGKAHIENGIKMRCGHVRMVLPQQREHFVKTDSVIL